MLLSNLVFSLRLPNIIGLNYQRMLILLTYKEPMTMFFDTVSRVKIFVEGRGVAGSSHICKYSSRCGCACNLPVPAPGEDGGHGEERQLQLEQPVLALVTPWDYQI